MTDNLIAVVDGQGGGIGRTLVEKLREALGGEAHILALGTNARATEQMLRAGASDGATGENAIVINAPRARVIVGVTAIIVANAMLGELTPKMATAISGSPAEKVLIPLNRCGVTVVGVQRTPLPQLIDTAVNVAASLVIGG